MKKLMAFYAEFHANFSTAEQYMAEQKFSDWTSEYVPAWRSFVCISTIYRICAAKRKWRYSAPLARPRVVKWTRREDGRTFSVTCYDEHRLKLVQEVAAYYAIAPCENKRDWKSADRLDERGLRDQRKQMQQARRKRWVESVRGSSMWSVEF